MDADVTTIAADVTMDVAVVITAAAFPWETIPAATSFGSSSCSACAAITDGDATMAVEAVTAAGSSSFCFFCAAITAADVDADPDLFLHFPGQRLTPLPFGNSFLLSARLLHPSFFLLLFSHTFHIYLIKSIPLDHKLFVILFHFFTPGHS